MGRDSRARHVPVTGAVGDGDHPTQAAVPGHNAAPTPGHSTPPVQATQASMEDERCGEYGAVAAHGTQVVAPIGDDE